MHFYQLTGRFLFQIRLMIRYYNTFEPTGLVTGRASVFTDDKQYTIELAVSGQSAQVRNFAGSRFLQLRFTPLTEQEINAIPHPPSDPIALYDLRTRLTNRLEQLLSFTATASPEKLARLDQQWVALTAGRTDEAFMAWLDQGIGTNIMPGTGENASLGRTIYITHIVSQATGVTHEGYGQLTFVLDPTLTYSNLTDDYYPNVNGDITAQISKTNGQPLLTLYGDTQTDDGVIINQASLGDAVSANTQRPNLMLRVSGPVPLDYELSAECVGLWRQG
jgi:hypothetical protein